MQRVQLELVEQSLLHCDIAPQRALQTDLETNVTPDMTIGTPRRWLKPLCLAGAFLFLLTALSLMTSQRANAQFGGRVATVAVEEAGEDVLSIFADIQGRVAAGANIAITATTNATTKLGEFQIGDRVKAGQVVAQQDASDLRLRLDLLTAQLAEAKLRLTQTEQGMTDDLVMIDLLEAQLDLLRRKAERADTLAARNAVSVDAVDTARAAEIRARETLAQRRALLAAKSIQKQLGEAAIDRITLEIRALKSDIADTSITAPADGQIIFIQPSRIGFNRTGDVLMRTRATSDFEVEADIPLEYIGFVAMTRKLEGADSSGSRVALQLRVILPIQNLRTGTQTARFSVTGDVPRTLRAENAPVTLLVPTTSPAPVVVVSKDAVIPVSGGHILFVAEDGVAVQRRIRLGNAAGDKFVILDGVAPGELVITRGNEGLVDGKKIKIGDPALRPAGPKGEKWTLNWNTRRGPASGELLIGKDKSLFNDEPVEIVRAGDDINFIGKLVLPFGVLDLDFDGTIDGDSMGGKLTIRGLPGGNAPVVDFTGTKGGN